MALSSVSAVALADEGAAWARYIAEQYHSGKPPADLEGYFKVLMEVLSFVWVTVAPMACGLVEVALATRRLLCCKAFADSPQVLVWTDQLGSSLIGQKAL